jgi:hypothetical protein
VAHHRLYTAQFVGPLVDEDQLVDAAAPAPAGPRL